MNKITQKWNNASGKDKFVFFIWIFTFILLIAFVIAAAVVSKDSTDDAKKYANILAGLGSAFGIALIGSLLTTVAFAYAKKKGGK